jgi:hypothetical protein
MKSVRVLLVIALLLLVTPLTFAGTCVWLNDRCSTSTYTTGIGPTDDYDGTQATCENNGGIYYPTEQFSEVVYNGAAVCTSGCCCDDTTTAPNNPPRLRTEAGICTTGMFSALQQPGDASCSASCAVAQPPSTTSCGTGTIGADEASCVCGLQTATSGDIGRYCCWNGNIKNSAAECTAPTGNYCVSNTPVTSSCLCGTQTITSGVCCSGGVPAANVNVCPADPTLAQCGNLRKDTGEECDAPYSYVNGRWVAGTGAACLDINGDTATNEFCSSTCSCVTTTTPTCGDGVCAATETTNCPLDCTSPLQCDVPPSGTLRATYNSAANEVKLEWVFSTTTACYPLRQGHTVQRSSVSALESLSKPDAVWQVNRDSTSYTDTAPPVQSATVYYTLISYYNTPTGIKTATTWQQVNVPGVLCQQASSSYCLDAQTAINCNQYTPVKTICPSGANPSVCSVVDGTALCISASPYCDQCNGLFSSFVDDAKLIKDSPLQYSQQHACFEAPTCYKDSKDTSVALYTSCSGVASCTSYRTQSACEINQCDQGGGGTEACDWVPLSTNTTQGFCKATNDAMQHCRDCRALGSGCTESICEAISESCYYYPGNTAVTETPGCYDPEEVYCEMYTTENECTGSTVYDVNVTYNNGRRVNGTNTVLETSDDFLGLGKCVWTGLYCKRDADDNGENDITNPPADSNKHRALLRDFSDPITTILSAQGIYPRAFIVNYTNESGTTYVCFSRPSIPCYPTSTISTTGNTIGKLFTAEDSGAWELRYYSVDPSKNLEQVKTFPFTVDATIPEIRNYHVALQPFFTTGTNVRSYATITFETSEQTRCISTLRNMTSGDIVTNRVHGGSELDAYGTQFSLAYPQLPDGAYELTLSCTDNAQNTNTTQYPLVIDSNTDITHPSPNALRPPHNSGTVELHIETRLPATCGYGLRGTNFAAMTPFTQTGGTTHTATRTLTTGNYAYQVACTTDGVILYGGIADDIVFSIDLQPPATQLCDASATSEFAATCTKPFANTRAEYQKVTLRCMDGPTGSPSFGCGKETIYSCISAVGSTCTPTAQYTHEVQGTTPMLLHYQSVDAGSNREALRTLTLNLSDTTPPTLTFTVD